MTDAPQTIGRYKILERVGRGAMGVLYRGLDPVLDREVAIKVMAADFAEDGDEDTRSRFFREARAAARLQHRNIVTIFEFAEEHGVPYIVMEFLRGLSLSARMKQPAALSVDEKLDIVAELATGLQFAHENGIVHRDVKPGNVWLLDDGTVKLLDFGIAKAASSTLTRQGDVLGSAAYMAPEQIAGGQVDGRADIFSATVVLYELLAGRRPFESDSPTSTILKIMQEPPAPLDPAVIADLPPRLVEVISKGLQKKADDRYQSASELAAELQLLRISMQSAGETIFREPPGDETRFLPPPVVPGRGPQTPPEASTQPDAAAGWYGASPRTLVFAGGAAAMLLLLVVGVWWSSHSVRPTAKPVPSPNTSPEPPSSAQPAAATPVTPAPPPAPAPIALVRVVSEPDGASIEVDGRDSGLTTRADLKIGSPPPRRIRLTRKGFQAVDGRLTDAVLKAGSITLRLPQVEAVTVKVTATGSYPFEIYDGKQLVSPIATAHELTVPTQHVLRLVSSDYVVDSPIKVDAAAGRALHIQAPELGKLTIRSAMEQCRFFVNAHDFGFLPINARPIAAGTYNVQLKCPDGTTTQGTPVTITSGQTVLAKEP